MNRPRGSKSLNVCIYSDYYKTSLWDCSIYIWFKQKLLCSGRFEGCPIHKDLLSWLEISNCLKYLYSVIQKYLLHTRNWWRVNQDLDPILVHITIHVKQAWHVTLQESGISVKIFLYLQGIISSNQLQKDWCWFRLFPQQLQKWFIGRLNGIANQNTMCLSNENPREGGDHIGIFLFNRGNNL